MTQKRQLQDRRGLRFAFSAEAEIRLDTRGKAMPARVTELSFRGCFLETSMALQEQQRVRLRILHGNEQFEASADVLYVRPAGAGVTFAEIEPPFRNVLQSWILTGLDSQAECNHA